MSSAITERCVPLSEIVPRPDFQGMTVAQQAWVRAYLTSGETTGTYDAIAATRAAYPATSAQHLSSRACHVQSHKKVKHILNIAFGQPETELDLILSDLGRALRKSIRNDIKKGGSLSIATTRALDFYERHTWQKLTPSASRQEGPAAPITERDSASPKFKVGDLVRQEGSVYRITSLDADGNPLTADAVEFDR